MKLLQSVLIYSIFFYFIPNSTSFLMRKPKINTRIMFIHHHNNNNNPDKETVPFTPLQKTSGFFKLIRPLNILPSAFVSFTGGWIMNPQLGNLLHSPAFISGIANTIIIMSTSMILNDLFDIPLDKINNPDRPLITGEVKISEALGLSAILLGISEYLNFTYLPKNLQMVIHLAIANILLYTPVFKKIPLVKNISSAGLIAFSTFFAGLIANPNPNIVFDISSFFVNRSLGLLAINTQLLFFGSLYIEILLDIRDADGDKQNGINTLPVIYGNELAFELANRVAYFNILLNFTELSIIYNFYAGLILLLVYSPLLYQLKETKRAGFTKENIVKNSHKTTIPLFATLLYFCVLPLIVF